MRYVVEQVEPWDRFLSQYFCLPCQYSSTNVPHSSSSTCCSYQTDGRTEPGKFPKAMLLRELDRRALSVGLIQCLSSCLFRRCKITETWLNRATFLDLLCTVEEGPYRDGTSQLQPYQNSGGCGGCKTAPNCTLIRTAGQFSGDEKGWI